MNTGWKCTECGRCYAPHVSECAACNVAPKSTEDVNVYEFDGYRIKIEPCPHDWPDPYWSMIPYDPNITYPNFTLRDIGLPSPEYRVTCGSN